MKSLILVVLLAAAATAAVVSNEVPETVEGAEVADVDVKEIPNLFVTDVDELTEMTELTDEEELIDETAVATRRSLSLGSMSSSYLLVYNTEVKANAVANYYHIRNIRITTKHQITVILVTWLGTRPYATPSILNGGIGQSSVTIRIRSAVNGGYHYRIQVYVGELESSV